MLLIAGLIMAVTLWTSKKARSVIETSVDLSRQGEGSERFNSSILSRNLVRGTRNMAAAFDRKTPAKLKKWLESRFSPPDEITVAQTPDGAAFDMLRASVNLVVASMLIALGTSLKLPLSTTYVTFMVAMGTSLSDRAWGRESAVYRITGVLSVIGGWFFTALAAFIVSLIAAIILFYGGMLATVILLSIAGFLIYRTHKIHARRTNQRIADQTGSTLLLEYNAETLFQKCSLSIQKVLENSLVIFKETMIGLMDEDRKKLKSAKNGSDTLNFDTKRLKINISPTLANLKNESIETGHYYVQAIDYLREINHCISFIVMPIYEHVENNHKPLIPSQIDELSRINAEMGILYNEIMLMLQTKNFEDFDLIAERQQNVQRLIEETRKKQIKRIKNSETGTRNSILFLNLLSEIRNLSLFTVNLLKATREFEKAAHTTEEFTEEFI